MVTSSWFMLLPKGFTVETFESWYLDRHTVVAKQCQDLCRYCISRAFAAQPRQAHGHVFRIAQLWWESVEKLTESYRSYSGAAVLGDGSLNMTLDREVQSSIALTEDRQFKVERPAVFDPFRRGYRTLDGTIVKVLSYGMTDDDAIDDWYASRFADLGKDDTVREHVFGTSIKRTVQIGLVGSIPAEGQRQWDWVLELCFDSKGNATQFLDGDRFQKMWQELSARSTDTVLSVMRAQELFVSMSVVAHKEE